MPSSLANFPLAQRAQASAASPLTLPAPQSVQPLAPPPLLVPGGQDPQASANITFRYAALVHLALVHLPPRY